MLKIELKKCHARTISWKILASFPGPRPASRRLQYRTASDGKLGGGLGTRLGKILILYQNKLISYPNKLTSCPITSIIWYEICLIWVWNKLIINFWVWDKKLILLLTEDKWKTKAVRQNADICINQKVIDAWYASSPIWFWTSTLHKVLDELEDPIFWCCDNSARNDTSS